MAKMPRDLKPFLNEAQWEKLAVHQLSPAFREDVIDVLQSAFKGEDPDVMDVDDIAEVVELAQGLADDARVGIDTKADRDDVEAAEKLIKGAATEADDS